MIIMQINICLIIMQISICLISVQITISLIIMQIVYSCQSYLHVEYSCLHVSPFIQINILICNSKYTGYQKKPSCKMHKSLHLPHCCENTVYWEGKMRYYRRTWNWRTKMDSTMHLAHWTVCIDVFYCLLLWTVNAYFIWTVILLYLWMNFG